SANLGRLPQGGKQLFLDSGPAQYLRRPSPLGDIEQKRSGSVRHIDGTFAGEPEPYAVLGQHDSCHTLPVLRFVFANPEQLRQGEICERRIASQANKPIRTEHVGEFPDLLFRALVAPDNGGPYDLVLSVQQDRPMHLSGETNTGDVISGDARVVQREAHGLAEGSPPIPGILLRPTLVGGDERLVVFCSRRNHSSAFVHDQGTGPAGADINSEKRDIPSFCESGTGRNDCPGKPKTCPGRALRYTD